MSTFEFRAWAIAVFIIVVVIALAVTCGVGGHSG